MQRLLRAIVRLVAVLAAWQTAAATTISIAPAITAVPLGSSFSINVQVNNALPAGVGDYDITVSFDGSIVAATGVTFGTFLGGPANSFQTDSIGSNAVEFAEVSLEDPMMLQATQPNLFTLASITFSTSKLGSTRINFTATTIDDVNGFSVSITANSGFAAVVPEPSSEILTLVGVAFVLLLGHRRFLRFNRTRSNCTD